MSDKNNNKFQQLITVLKELPSGIKIAAIVCVSLIVFNLMLGFTSELEEETIFTIHTLSSEELKGETYTEKTTFDDSDMWETEIPEEFTTRSELSETTDVVTLVVEFPLDVNLANMEELMAIDGIGSVTAEKIIDYRNKYGYFYNYDELLNIDGIGDKKLNSLLKYIYISDEFLDVTEVPQTVSEKVTVNEVPYTEYTESIVKETVTVSVEITEEFEIINEEFIVEDMPDEDFENEDEFEYEYESNYEYSNTEYTQSIYVDFPLELNSATAEQLMCINGIGEHTANKIVEYARMYGFYDVEDLLNVDGIGSAKLANIMPYVYVNSVMLPPQTETYFSETTALITTAVVIPKVNINTCGKYELMQLPGITEDLADKIIEFRTTIGGFIKIEEVSLVEGMTNEKMSAIWNYIYI